MTALPRPKALPARKPASGPKLVEIAYQEIKRRILDNEFAPNYQITESQLAELLGVSRTPVHEALIRLEKERLVENIPRHGMRVLPVSARDMLEIYQVLTALEAEAVLLIAERPATERGTAQLRQLIDAMDAALTAQDIRRWAEADGRLHRALFELCGNTRLMEAGLAFREQVDRARLLTLPLRPLPQGSNAAHRELVERLERGDAEAAFACHRRHRARVTAELTEILGRFQWMGL
ncbi:GntR family transcriptional regulator [Verticiella sediminum]|uniref:GntR family transcriptional regulator n=1 Tax=Verticiella sediminum TaxID=1247510 RepID=A0A556AS05_9BURK|nr:GntR family transcriptional regulator [Verticiella sediminum]TSH95717.1 GntR family transcriptional regulator [Verticiella sediminum]